MGQTLTVEPSHQRFGDNFGLDAFITESEVGWESKGARGEADMPEE